MKNEVGEIVREFYAIAPDLKYSVRARVVAWNENGKTVYRYETSHSCRGLTGGGDPVDGLDTNIRLAKAFLMSLDWNSTKENDWY